MISMVNEGHVSPSIWNPPTLDFQSSHLAAPEVRAAARWGRGGKTTIAQHLALGHVALPEPGGLENECVEGTSEGGCSKIFKEIQKEKKHGECENQTLMHLAIVLVYM